MPGPKAPRDPIPKRDSFYIMRRKEIKGDVRPDGTGVQFLYLNDNRLPGFAGIVGNVKDQKMLMLLRSAEGFRKMTAAIGVTVEILPSMEKQPFMKEQFSTEERPFTEEQSCMEERIFTENREQEIGFVFQMYGRYNTYETGTLLRIPIKPDGMEHVIELEEIEWSEEDAVPGQIRFEFPRAGQMAVVDVRLYLREGFTAPVPEEEAPVDTSSGRYQEMIGRSLMQAGSINRLKKVLAKAASGEDVTLSFIGGSITQGAGAVPIHENCYAYLTYKSFCERYAKEADNIHFIKAGVGGTSSELGMIRYERDVLREGRVEPDLVVVEFGVNDEGDETKGECYESLVRKILLAPNAPAVILLFNVFADDWNLQDRLSRVGAAYRLPMVSVRDAVTEQFYKNAGEKVLSKNQFFYDALHPNNMGHRIIADCLMNLMQEAQRQQAQEEPDMELILPVFGTEFQNIRLLDRKYGYDRAMIENGSFRETDKNLQAVEMDRSLIPTPQFPYNWMHVQGDTPFQMRIICTALVMVYKDSGDSKAGKAEVRVDGFPVLKLDPMETGWTHCNPVILFRQQERREHLIEISMLPGEEEKIFTILGFGFVE